jgi:hypothetical protein
LTALSFAVAVLVGLVLGKALIWILREITK